MREINLRAAHGSHSLGCAWRDPIPCPGPRVLGKVLDGSRTRRPVLEPHFMSRQASLQGQHNAECRLGLCWESVPSLPWGSAGPGVGLPGLIYNSN